MKRRHPHWKTRFGTFVSRHTVALLRRDLALAGVPTHEKTVYSWISGQSTPRPERMVALLKIGRGRLRAEDLLRHRSEVRRVEGRGKGPLARGPAEGDRRD
jgi:hypothetical protein